jgi:aminoglycoside phosphotransferase (APT) family kinase protein
VPETHGAALEQLIDAIVDVHAVDWNACGLGDLARPERYLERQSNGGERSCTPTAAAN